MLYSKRHKHKWVKKQYDGLSIRASWEYCLLCGDERNRKVVTLKKVL